MACDGVLRRVSKAVLLGVGGSTLPSADDDLLDELIGDIGNISNVGTDVAVTSDDQLLLEMQELLS